MVELDIFVVDVPSQQRVLVGSCIAKSLASEDVREAARSRILFCFRNHTGLYYTPPILLEETSTLLKYGVIWKDGSVEYAQYDLYVVEVSTDDEADEAITEPIDLPYRNNTMMGTFLNMMQPSFRQQRASKRVRSIMRGDDL